MTNREIAAEISQEIKVERRSTNRILVLINLAQERRVYADLGFSSMYDWLVRGFGYSHSAAYRRIEAARLLKAVPAISKKLERGEVNLTTISKAQSVFKAHERMSGQRISMTLKADVVRKIENKSAQQAEQILLNVFPGAASTVHQERKTIVNDTTIRLSTNISVDMDSDIKRARELLSHKYPTASDAVVLAHALKFFLDATDPLRKQVRTSPVNKIPMKTEPVSHADETALVGGTDKITSAAEANCVKSTTLLENKSVENDNLKPAQPQSLASVRRAVIQQADAACSFRDPLTGTICGSRYQIQIDHIVPRALGGGDSPENLRVLCREHNIHEAENKLGKDLMDKYRRQPD